MSRVSQTFSKRATIEREESETSTASRQGYHVAEDEAAHQYQPPLHEEYREMDDAEGDHDDDHDESDETDSDDSGNHVRKIKKAAPEDITAGDVMKLTMLAFKEERISALPHHQRTVFGEEGGIDNILSSTGGGSQQQQRGQFLTNFGGASNTATGGRSGNTTPQNKGINYTPSGLKMPPLNVSKGGGGKAVGRSISLTGNALTGLVSAVSQNSTATRFMHASQLVADVMHTTNNAHHGHRHATNVFGKGSPNSTASAAAGDIATSPPAILEGNYAQALKTKKVDYLLYNNPMVTGSATNPSSETNSARQTPSSLLSPNSNSGKKGAHFGGGSGGAMRSPTKSPAGDVLKPNHGLQSGAVSPSNSIARGGRQQAAQQQQQPTSTVKSSAAMPSSASGPLSAGPSAATAAPKQFLSTFVPVPKTESFLDLNSSSLTVGSNSMLQRNDRYKRHHSVASLTFASAAASSISKSKSARKEWFASGNNVGSPVVLPIDPIGHSVVASKCDPGFVYRLPSTLAEENVKRAALAAKAKKVIRAAIAIGGASALADGGAKKPLSIDTSAVPNAVDTNQPAMSANTNGKPPTFAKSAEGSSGSPTKTNLKGRDSVVTPLSPSVLALTPASPAAASASSPIVGPRFSEISHPALPPTVHGKADTTVTLFSSVFSREAEMARAVDAAPLSARAGNGGGKPFPHNNFSALIGTVNNTTTPAPSPQAASTKAGGRNSVMASTVGGASPIVAQSPVSTSSPIASTKPQVTQSMSKGPPPSTGAVTTRPSSSSPATRSLQGSPNLHATPSGANPIAMLLQNAMAAAMPPPPTSTVDDENHTVLDDPPYIDTLRDTLFPALALALEKLLVDGKAMQIELERNRMLKGIPDPVSTALKAVRPKLGGGGQGGASNNNSGSNGNNNGESAAASRLASNARKSASGYPTALNSSATVSLPPLPENTPNNNLQISSTQPTPRPSAVPTSGTNPTVISPTDSRPMTGDQNISKSDRLGAGHDNMSELHDSSGASKSVSRAATNSKYSNKNHTNFVPPSIIGKNRPRSAGKKEEHNADDHYAGGIHEGGDGSFRPTDRNEETIPLSAPDESSINEQLNATGNNVLSVSNSARATPVGVSAAAAVGVAEGGNSNTRPLIGRSNSIIGIGSRKRISSAIGGKNGSQTNKDEANSSVTIRDPSDPAASGTSGPAPAGGGAQYHPNTSPGLPQYGVPGNSRRAPHDSTAQKKALAAAAASFFNSKKTFPAGPIESFLVYKDPLDLVDPAVIAERANANVFRSAQNVGGGNAGPTSKNGGNGMGTAQSPHRRASAQAGGILSGNSGLSGGITLPGMPQAPTASAIAAIAASQTPVNPAAAIRFFAMELKRIGQEQKAAAERERASVAAATNPVAENPTTSPQTEALMTPK